MPDMNTPEEIKTPPKTLNIDRISGLVRNQTGVIKEHCGIVISSAYEQIYKQLAAGGRVVLTGVGTFTLRVRKERIARNPATGAQVFLPTHNVIHFKPNKNLKMAVLELPPGICPKGACNFAGKRP